ncbi:Histone-lysine N-methyltransferase 2C [Dissostichus eleginoides]|uniref:Histone-lysine N-methyltransferase 2C n=1 Tax=Dissostichus eleginoides TaxID=100907 RepID=A0AAD9FD39_DISEL|nr:Histone-lysine N-methyltransferase 2C [Dissostichus eleginoides]
MTKSFGEVLSTSPLPPPSLYSLGSSAVEDAGHMPRCHSPFPFSNLALSSVTAINHSRRHGDGALGEASVRPSVNTTGFFLRALRANALTSPTSRQRQESKDSYCPHTRIHTHLPDPQHPQMNRRRTNVRAKGNHKMSGEATAAQKL